MRTLPPPAEKTDTMKTRALIWHIYPAYLAIVVFGMGAAAWYAAHTIRVFHYAQTERELRSAAAMVEDELSREVSELSVANVDALCKRRGESSGYRITVVNPSGKVVGDSRENPGIMDDHSDRPEIRKALQTGVGTSQRFSHTLNMNMMYVALPLQRDALTLGVVRIALSLAEIDGHVSEFRRRIITVGLVLAILATVVSIAVAHRINRPLVRMRTGAQSFAHGDLATRLPPSTISEVNLLSQTMNDMAAQLSDRIATVTKQRDEQDALFECMTEAVIAVNNQRQIIRINHAAEALFTVKEDSCRGRNLVEIVRNSDLQDIVEKVLNSTTTVEGQVDMFHRNLNLQAHGTSLRDESGNRLGAVIVLNDVTRLRHLETVRRDFVGNVSHELKTPVTAIVGFLETLRAGAAENRDDRERFLAIIDKHARRLKSIIEDLLTLSRLEHEASHGTPDLAETPLAPVLHAAANVCREAAQSRRMTVSVDCPSDLRMRVEGRLLEQAVTNLVDNAVKYAEAGTPVTITTVESDREVVIRVSDKGPGIEHQHLARLFERFYRIDSGRSRALGGTGLGLAIVKHVAQRHGGRVEVASQPGRGTTFSLYLPKAYAP